jgi:NAD-dependent DNA ligase
MTFEKLLEGILSNKISMKDVREELLSKDKMKTINYFIHRNIITKDTMSDSELSQLKAIVEILQILYNSGVENIISDSDYDVLQEMLIDVGIPRLTGSIEINNSSKISHTYTNLRGTLNKIYYLYSTQKQTNKSRKYLDDWIKSAELKYERNSGKKIDLNDARVICQPKLDGASAVLEISGDKKVWITRGDTENNKASDISHIMNVFNDLYSEYDNCGIKFEIVMSENNKNKINELYTDKPYKNSRQIVTATINSKEPDFKVDYLFPVPLRICYGDDIEKIHPFMLTKFPNLICKLSDRDLIKEFADKNKIVNYNDMKFRTDGVVLTILDENIQKVLGRDNNINNFEVAYKFTAESAYTKVKDCEFYISEMGFITPVLVVNDVILKGNNISHISLSNKERFDELDLHYADEVLVEYDIIPYVTIDDRCRRVKNGRKIEFVDRCPKCKSELDLNQIQVQCMNNDCPARKIGRIVNYCKNLRMENIGYQTLETLFSVGLIKNIKSLYKLHKKTLEIEDLDGFGHLKTKKIVGEIESRRRLKDYELLGSIGIEGLSMKSFQLIFSKIKYQDFLNMIILKNLELLFGMLIKIDGMGPKKAELVLNYFNDTEKRIEFQKLLKELSIQSTYSESSVKENKRIVVSGFRPSESEEREIENLGYEVSDSWSNKAKYLIIPDKDFVSNKVNKAVELGVPILYREDFINTLKL